jgi:small-conductance mechanosensitive channel
MNATIKQTSTKAIISAIAGVLGWTLLPILGSLTAIIAGHMARAEIRRNPDTLTGDGWALAGLILGWLSVIIAVLSVVFLLLFFGGLAAALVALGIASH